MVYHTPGRVKKVSLRRPSMEPGANFMPQCAIHLIFHNAPLLRDYLTPNIFVLLISVEALQKKLFLEVVIAIPGPLNDVSAPSHQERRTKNSSS